MAKTSLVELQKGIGNAAAKARLDQGLTQPELARSLKTHQANISRIELGLQNLSLDLHLKIELS